MDAQRRAEIEADLKEADAQNWRYVGNEAPPLNTRVEVMHILNRSYDTDGECDAKGAWHCSNGFILPNGLFTFNPTHWRPKPVGSETATDAAKREGEA